MTHTRRTTAASLIALGFLSAPAAAQQTIIYSDPAFQQQPGQTFLPQQPFGNQPIFVDPNTGQPLLPQQPPFPQPQQDFGQQQQQFQPQPQTGFGQPAPQPNFGSPLPQPGQAYNPPQPEITIAPGPSAPQQQPNPYYDRAGTQPQPQQPQQPQPLPQIGTALPQIAQPEPPLPPEPAIASPLPAESGAVFQTPAGGDRGPEMSAELDALLAVGERYRAASPGFLEDLKSLARKYRDPLPQLPAPVAVDPSQPPVDGTDVAVLEGDPAVDPTVTDPDLAPSDPGTVATFDSGTEVVTVVPPLDPGSVSFAFLEDDFTDGELNNNPSWRVRQGDWGIDPKYGLRAKAPAETSGAPVSPKELLKVLLTGDTPQSDGASTPQAALIEAQTDIGNAFSFAARIVDHAGTGTAHFIMHQGGANWLGYRLELRSGPQPVVVLTRRGSNGYKDITKVSAPEFKPGKQHELRWARLSTGQMIVLLNGRPIITSRDTVFRENWKGFAFFNAGGDVSIRTIRVSAPVER